jgi:SH3-like domain-containing protein
MDTMGGGRLISKGLFVALAVLFCASAQAVDFVSVSEKSAILYDAPSVKAKKLFVVNRYMPFEMVISLNNWSKVRDNSGAMYWIEKQMLTNKRFVFALSSVVDIVAQPAPGATRLFQVRKQVALEYLESSGDGWIKVRHQDKDVGYVRSTDVWGE